MAVDPGLANCLTRIQTWEDLRGRWRTFHFVDSTSKSGRWETSLDILETLPRCRDRDPGDPPKELAACARGSQRSRRWRSGQKIHRNRRFFVNTKPGAIHTASTSKHVGRAGRLAYNTPVMERGRWVGTERWARARYSYGRWASPGQPVDQDEPVCRNRTHAL